jgi:alpha-N-acetylglucosamine transferase
MLSEYDKVCIIESDIIVTKGFENIFKFEIPVAHIYIYLIMI